MSCTRTIEDSKPQRREGRQGNDFFRIGTDDSEKIPALRAISAYCRAARPQVSAVPPSATCRVVARRAKPEADRLFSFADLRIGKRKLSVLGALSEAGGSSFSLGQLAPGSKDLSALRITL